MVTRSPACSICVQVVCLTASEQVGKKECRYIVVCLLLYEGYVLRWLRQWPELGKQDVQP
jgi:hypothetical protein